MKYEAGLFHEDETIEIGDEDVEYRNCHFIRTRFVGGRRQAVRFVDCTIELFPNEPFGIVGLRHWEFDGCLISMPTNPPNEAATLLGVN